jgi:hypothetical protein
MTRYFDATFEAGSLTTAPDGATAVVGTVTLDTSSVVKKANSALHNTAASLLRFDITASDDIYVSFYLYITVGGQSVRTCYITNGARISIRSDRSLRLEDFAGGAIGSNSAVLALNTLYRVGFHWRKATVAANDGQAEAYLATGDADFGTAFSTSTTLTPTSQLSRIDLGNTAGAVTNTFYTDDVRIDDTAMPGPSVIGPPPWWATGPRSMLGIIGR